MPTPRAPGVSCRASRTSATLSTGPGKSSKLAILALLIGLPVVLVLAWYHGDRGEQRVSRTELAILTLLFLLGGGIFWRYQRTTEARRQPRPRPPPRPTSAATTADARPSIAVLPFENRSAKQDDAFFVDGIHDDILTQLSKVSALKVISRTSVEQFRDTKLPNKDIAEQLGVKSILEGGVQRAGDRVRINVQLIDAAPTPTSGPRPTTASSPPRTSLPSRARWRRRSPAR